MKSLNKKNTESNLNNYLLSRFLNWENTNTPSVRDTLGFIYRDWFNVVGNIDYRYDSPTSKSNEGRSNIQDHLKEIIAQRILLNDFKNELERNKDSLGSSREMYESIFSYFSRAIIPLKPTKIDLKFTPSDSIYLKFLLDNTYYVRIEIFLDDLVSFDENIIEAVLNIDEDGEQIFGTICSLSEVINYLFQEVNLLKLSPFQSLDTSGNYELQSSHATEELDTSA